MDDELKPIIDPDEPRRRRAYRICLMLSLVLVGGGALWFLVQEVVSLAQIIPQEFATPEVEQAIDGLGQVGSEASERYQGEVKPELGQVLEQINANAQEVVSASTDQE